MKNLALGLLLASSALPVFAEGNFSAEFLYGTADQKSSIKDGDSTDGADLSVGIRGAYKINGNIAFELAYQDYGETDDVYIDDFSDTINDKVSSSAFNIGAKGIVPFDSGFSLYGRIGLSFWGIDIKETDSSLPGEELKVDDSGNDYYYGLGFQYDITPQFVIGTEYTITEMDVSVLNLSIENKVKKLSLALGYKF